MLKPPLRNPEKTGQGLKMLALRHHSTPQPVRNSLLADADCTRKRPIGNSDSVSISAHQAGQTSSEW